MISSGDRRPGFSSRHHIGQLRVHVFPPEDARFEGVVEVPHDLALIQHVRHHGGGREQVRDPAPTFGDCPRPPRRRTSPAVPGRARGTARATACRSRTRCSSPPPPRWSLTGSTSMPSSRRHLAREHARPCPLSRRRRRPSSAARRGGGPASWARPWMPQPQIVTASASGRASHFAATAVAAAVRRSVTSIESMTASGRPSSASKSTITPWMAGSPWRAGLPGKLALILAAK